MRKPQVFFSLHFERDIYRAEQIRAMGIVECNLFLPRDEWEKRKKMTGGVEKWIDASMRHRDCIIVLIGTETAARPWVRYEIKKAWTDGMSIVGIYIHNIKDPRYEDCPPLHGKCIRGADPFAAIRLNNGMSLSHYVTCYDPNPRDSCMDIASNLVTWIKNAAVISSS